MCGTGWHLIGLALKFFFFSIIIPTCKSSLKVLGAIYGADTYDLRIANHKKHTANAYEKPVRATIERMNTRLG